MFINKFYIEERDDLDSILIKGELYDEEYCLKDKPIHVLCCTFFYTENDKNKLIHLGVSKALCLRLAKCVVSILNLFCL